MSALDQEFLDALEADLAVGGLLADESGLGEGGRRKCHRQQRQVSDCEGHYGRELPVARGPGLEYNRDPDRRGCVRLGVANAAGRAFSGGCAAAMGSFGSPCFSGGNWPRSLRRRSKSSAARR